MRQIKSAVFGILMAISMLPASAADFRQLNNNGIAALRAGNYAQAVSFFEDALNHYSPESSHYDDGIKSNLKLAQELLLGKSPEDSAPKIHAGYISKQSESPSLYGAARNTAKILRPLPPSTDRSANNDWNLSTRDGGMDNLSGQVEYNNAQMMRARVEDFASRLRYLMQAANEGRTALRSRINDIEARVAAMDRDASLQARNAYIPRYIPPPAYQAQVQRSYAPYVPLLPAPDV